MISHILSKSYGHILENNISRWLEIHCKIAKDQVGFRRYHSIVDQLVTHRITVEDSHNNKIGIFCYFFDFRKTFDMIPRTKLWKGPEELNGFH